MVAAARAAAGQPGGWRERAALPFLDAAHALQCAAAGAEEEEEADARDAALQAAPATAGEADVRERAFTRFFVRSNATTFCAAGGLMLLGSVSMLYNCYSLVLSAAEPPALDDLPMYSGNTLRSLQLFSLQPGDDTDRTVPLMSLPWADVQQSTRLYCALFCACVLPFQLLYMAASLRLAGGRVPMRYNTLFGLCSAVEALDRVAVDAAVYSSTGLLLLWPLSLTTVCNALCFVLLLRSGPFTRPSLVVAYHALRMLCDVAFVLRLKPGLLLTRAALGYHVQAAGNIVAIAQAWSRNARMRAAFAAERKARSPAEAAAEEAAAAAEAAEAASHAQRRQLEVAVVAEANLTNELVVGVLMLLGAMASVGNMRRHALARDKWPEPSELGINAPLLTGARMWPLADPAAPPFPPTDVSWEAVRDGAAVMERISCVLLAPLYGVFLLAAVALRARRLPLALYEPLLATISAVEIASFSVGDILAARASGAAMEYAPFGPQIITAIMIVWMGSVGGPFRPPVIRSLLAFKAAAVAAPLLVARRPLQLLRNPGSASLLAACALNAALAKRRVDRLCARALLAAKGAKAD